MPYILWIASTFWQDVEVSLVNWSPEHMWLGAALTWKKYNENQNALF